METPRDETAEENFATTPDRNVDFQPESRHECSICLNWLQEPVLTPCGHRFCKECILAWLQNKDFCPIDNFKLNKEADLFPDNYTKREILQQRVVCPFAMNGCPVQLGPLELEGHINQCEHRNTASRSSLRENKIPCSFKDLGCDCILKNEEYLARHMESSVQNHLRLLMTAYSTLKVDQNLAGTSTSQLEHEATAFWDPNDKGEEAAVAQQSCGQAMPIKALIRSLFEKVIILEQQNREQDITIGNMSRVLKSITTSQTRFFEDLSLKYCMGFYVWKIDTFNSKLEHMVRNPAKMFYSQGFYTTPNGYRFCCRMNLSPIHNKSIALHVHLMKTDNDEFLEWPFHGSIQITLINPSFPKMCLKDTMMSVPTLEAFQRPRSDICPKGFGYAKYVSIHSLKLQGYIVDDSVQIRIKIQQINPPPRSN